MGLNQKRFTVKTFEEHEQKVKDFFDRYNLHWKRPDLRNSYRINISIFNEDEIKSLSDEHKRSRAKKTCPVLFAVTDSEDFLQLLESCGLGGAKSQPASKNARYYTHVQFELHEILDLPAVLYHYTTADAAILILKNNTIRFSHPSLFKDDFDTKFHHFYLQPDAVVVDAERYDLSSLINRGLESFRIFCMTKNPNISSMWVHYAENQTGVVLGFNTGVKPGLFYCVEPHVEPHVEAHQVRYRVEDPIRIVAKDPHPMDDDQYLRENIVIPLIKTKSTHWAYEQEIRLVTTCLQERNKNVEPTVDHHLKFLEINLPERQVRRIILGRKIKPVEEFEICKMVQAMELPIVIRKVVSVTRRYGYKTKILYNGPKELAKRRAILTPLTHAARDLSHGRAR